jgi:hypothetical protein
MLPAVAIAAQMLQAAPAAPAVAAFRVYNSTAWEGSVPVEVPVGSIATPGLIDWGAVTLMSGDKEIPFSIREGRAHWKSQLTIVSLSPSRTHHHSSSRLKANRYQSSIRDICDARNVTGPIKPDS